MADFYTPGVTELYYKDRTAFTNNNSPWMFIGTAVEAPEIEAEVITTPFNSELSGPAPFQQIFNSEIHTVTATLNRLNYTNWRDLRLQFQGGLNRKFGTLWQSPYAVGQPMLNNTDFALLIKYSASRPGGPTLPAGVTTDRIYYSCLLQSYHESTINNRVEEVSLAITCYPYYKITIGSATGSQNPSPGSNSKIPVTTCTFTLYTENTDPATTLE